MLWVFCLFFGFWKHIVLFFNHLCILWCHFSSWKNVTISEYFFLFWTICTGSWIVPPKYFPSVESLKPSHNVIPPQYGPLIGWYSWHHPPRLHKCLTIYPNRGYSTYGYIVIRSIYKTIWPEHSHFPICLRTMNLGTPHDLTCPLHGILPKKVPIYDTSMSTPSVSMTKSRLPQSLRRCVKCPTISESIIWCKHRHRHWYFCTDTHFWLNLNHNFWLKLNPVARIYFRV